MQPLILDEFWRMGSSFAIALMTAYDYFAQGQWADGKLTWVPQWVQNEYFMSKLGDVTMQNLLNQRFSICQTV